MARPPPLLTGFNATLPLDQTASLGLHRRPASARSQLRPDSPSAALAHQRRRRLALSCFGSILSSRATSFAPNPKAPEAHAEPRRPRPPRACSLPAASTAQPAESNNDFSFRCLRPFLSIFSPGRGKSSREATTLRPWPASLWTVSRSPATRSTSTSKVSRQQPCLLLTITRYTLLLRD